MPGLKSVHPKAQHAPRRGVAKSRLSFALEVWHKSLGINLGAEMICLIEKSAVLESWSRRRIDGIVTQGWSGPKPS